MAHGTSDAPRLSDHAAWPRVGDVLGVFASAYRVELGAKVWVESVTASLGPWIDFGGGVAAHAVGLGVDTDDSALDAGPWAGDAGVCAKWRALLATQSERLVRDVTGSGKGPGWEWLVAGREGLGDSAPWPAVLVLRGVDEVTRRGIWLVAPSLQPMGAPLDDHLSVLRAICVHIGRAAGLVPIGKPRAPVRATSPAPPPAEESVLAALSAGQALTATERLLAWRQLTRGELEAITRFTNAGTRYTVAAVPASAEGTYEPLTRREWEVCALVAAGLSNKTIADQLAITPSTVGTIIGRAMKKFDCGSRVELATRICTGNTKSRVPRLRPPGSTRTG